MIGYLKALIAIVLGYVVFGLVNMSTVLLMFPAPGFREQVLGPLMLLLLEVLIIGSTSILIIKGLIKLLKIKNMHSLYLMLCLIVAVMGVNIYLDQSVEPLWYKVVYVVVVALSVLLAVKHAAKLIEFE